LKMRLQFKPDPNEGKSRVDFFPTIISYCEKPSVREGFTYT
jgi:hypothetical protein